MILSFSGLGINERPLANTDNSVLDKVQVDKLRTESLEMQSSL